MSDRPHLAPDLEPGIRVRRVISGGQTGADRGGLEAARRVGLSLGGWCPRGRRAEDGPIPLGYPLDETPSASYAQRTDWNVRDSQATVLLTRGAPTGGSALTAARARVWRRPCLHLDLAALDEAAAARRLAGFLVDTGAEVLNVAGSRESQAPGLEAATARILTAALVPGTVSPPA